MAWVVAMLATVGSLYFSEIAHYDPCRLCWYQRIAMYPLVVILGIAAFRRDDGIRIYGRALAAIGAVIATYHLALEWIPSLDTGACGLGTPCTLVWFRALGFVSLPFLALSAFLLIFTLLSVRAPEAVTDDFETLTEPSWRTE
jgi:disulfide bond formation protein DsbB